MFQTWRRKVISWGNNSMVFFIEVVDCVRAWVLVCDGVSVLYIANAFELNAVRWYLLFAASPSQLTPTYRWSCCGEFYEIFPARRLSHSLEWLKMIWDRLSVSTLSSMLYALFIFAQLWNPEWFTLNAKLLTSQKNTIFELVASTNRTQYERTITTREREKEMLGAVIDVFINNAALMMTKSMLAMINDMFEKSNNASSPTHSGPTQN